jgi:hypothetical protein
MLLLAQNETQLNSFILAFRPMYYMSYIFRNVQCTREKIRCLTLLEAKRARDLENSINQTLALAIM